MNREPVRGTMPTEAEFARMKELAKDPRCIAELKAMGDTLDPQFVRDMTDRLARISNNDPGRHDH